eukprot:GEMP01000930.1.p1 GENE.GEMP01000930.1~~GEMP01000930.1.p1  ORF type:complete len:1448 (+),score=332.75 GEMP01000930.1:166-4509(+)
MASEIPDIDVSESFVENVRHSVMLNPSGSTHSPIELARSTQSSQRSQMDARSPAVDQDGANAEFVSLTDVKDNIIRSLQDRLDRSRFLETELGTMQHHMQRNEEIQREMEEQLQIVYQERDSSISEAAAAQQLEAELRDEIAKYQDLLREANDRNEFHKQAYLDNQQARILLEDLVMTLRSRFAQCWHFFSTVSARCQLPTLARFAFFAWAKECRGRRAAHHRRSSRLSLVDKCTETVALARAWQLFVRATAISRFQELESLHKRNAKKRFSHLVDRQGDSTRQQLVGEAFSYWSSFTQQRRATMDNACKLKGVLQRCGMRSHAAILETIWRSWVEAFRSRKRLLMGITLTTEVGALKDQIMLARQAFFVWCTYTQMRLHFVQMERHFDHMQNIKFQLKKPHLVNRDVSQGTAASSAPSTRLRSRTAEDSSAPTHADDLAPPTSTRPVPPFVAFSPPPPSRDLHRPLYDFDQTRVPPFVACSPPFQPRTTASDRQMPIAPVMDDGQFVALADEEAWVNLEEADGDVEEAEVDEAEMDPEAADWNRDNAGWDHGASWEAQGADASMSPAAQDLRYDTVRSWEEDDDAWNDEENWNERVFVSVCESMSDEEPEMQSQFMPADTVERSFPVPAERWWNSMIDISDSDRSPPAYGSVPVAFRQTSPAFGAVGLDHMAPVLDSEWPLHVRSSMDQPQSSDAERAQTPSPEPPHAAMGDYADSGIQKDLTASSSPVQSSAVVQRPSFFPSYGGEPQYVRLSLDFAGGLEESERQFYSCVSAPVLSADDEAEKLYADIINVDSFPLDSEDGEDGETLATGGDGLVFDGEYGGLPELVHFSDAEEQLQGSWDAQKTENGGLLKSETPNVNSFSSDRTADATTSFASANHASFSRTTLPVESSPPSYVVATGQADLLHTRNTVPQDACLQGQRESGLKLSYVELDNDAEGRNTVCPNIHQVTEQTVTREDVQQGAKLSAAQQDTADQQSSAPSGYPASAPSLHKQQVSHKTAPPFHAAKPVDSGPHPRSDAVDPLPATRLSQNRVSFQLDDTNTFLPQEGHISLPVGSNAPSFFVNRGNSREMRTSFGIRNQPKLSSYTTSGVSSVALGAQGPIMQSSEGATMGSMMHQQGQIIQQSVMEASTGKRQASPLFRGWVLPMQSSRAVNIVTSQDTRQRSASTEGQRPKQLQIDAAVQEFHRVVKGTVFVRDAQGNYSVNGTSVQLNVTPAGLELVDGVCSIPAMQFVAWLQRSSGTEQTTAPINKVAAGTYLTARSSPQPPSMPMHFSPSFPFFTNVFPATASLLPSKPILTSRSLPRGVNITPPERCPQPTGGSDVSHEDDFISTDIPPDMDTECCSIPALPLSKTSSFPLMNLRHRSSNRWQKHEEASRQPHSTMASNVRSIGNPSIVLQRKRPRLQAFTGMNFPVQGSYVGLTPTLAHQFVPPIGLGTTSAQEDM